MLQVLPPPRSSDDDGGTSAALIGGIIAAAVAAVVLLTLVAILLVRRYRSPGNGHSGTGASGTTAASVKTTGASYTTATTVRASATCLFSISRPVCHGRPVSGFLCMHAVSMQGTGVTMSSGMHPQAPFHAAAGSGDSGIPDSPMPSTATGTTPTQATPTAGAASLPSYLQPSTSAQGPLYGPPTQPAHVNGTRSISPDSSSGSPAFGAAGTPLGRIRRVSDPALNSGVPTNPPQRTPSGSGSGSGFSIGSAVLGPGTASYKGSTNGADDPRNAPRASPMPMVIEQSEGGTEMTMTASADLEAEVVRLPSPAMGSTTVSSRGREVSRTSSPAPVPEGVPCPPRSMLWLAITLLSAPTPAFLDLSSPSFLICLRLLSLFCVRRGASASRPTPSKFCRFPPAVGVQTHP